MEFCEFKCQTAPDGLLRNSLTLNCSLNLPRFELKHLPNRNLCKSIMALRSPIYRKPGVPKLLFTQPFIVELVPYGASLCWHCFTTTSVKHGLATILSALSRFVKG